MDTDDLEKLSRQAFLGKAVFLEECAMATDFSEEAPVLPNRKRPSNYCYFIAAESGPIKIGTARKPYERLMTLQCGNPEPLYIYAIAKGGALEEKALHSEFNAWRYSGEWFERSHPILRRIIQWQQDEAAEIKRLKTL